MNKKGIILSLAVIFALSGFSIANAADTSAKTKVKGNVETQAPQRPPFGEFQGVPPLHEKFDGKAPIEHFGKPPKHMGKLPSKEEMEAKKAEIDKRLKLTDEQKQAIEVQKKQDIEKMKPIFDDIHKKKQEFKKVMDDKSLSQAEKDKKIKDIKSDLHELKGQADSLRKENMNNFENILTEKQKKEFTKIKNEQKKEMEKRRKVYEKPVMPKITETK